jgi:hypothetical protein
LCFGESTFYLFVALPEEFIPHHSMKEFCELLSYIALRFIKNIIFSAIKKESGQPPVLKNPLKTNELADAA